MAESSTVPEASEGGALNDVVFGSIAGMAAKVFEHPFDLVKVRLQSQPTDRPLTFAGPLDCFKQTYGKEGLRGLYRGISAPIFGAACENATLFLVYNRCQDLIRLVNPGPATLSEKAQGKKRELSTPELAIAGAGAGTAASFVLTPIELIKCRMQVQMLAREGAFGSSGVAAAAVSGSTAGPWTIAGKGAGSSRGFSTSAPRLIPLQTPPANLPPLEGPIQLVVSTIRSKGLRGLWLGQTGTLLRESGGGMAWFTAYEATAKYFLQARQRLSDASGGTRKLVKSDLKTYELMLSGAAAGVSYNVILFPADSIKSAIQTAAELNPSARPLGFAEMGKRIWTTRGFRGLYAGCGLTVMRSAPSSAMIFAIYETLAAQFGHLLP